LGVLEGRFVPGEGQGSNGVLSLSWVDAPAIRTARGLPSVALGSETRVNQEGTKEPLRSKKVTPAGFLAGLEPTSLSIYPRRHRIAGRVESI